MPGQTQSEIRALLAAAGLAPRHRYGQNFLVDLNLMRKLVSAAELRPADVVLEVGCGTGSLTEMLLAADARVVGVEIDRGFQAILRERLGKQPRFTLIAGDALAGKHQVNPLILRVLAGQTPEAGGDYKLVANLPYDIATPLLLELLYASPRFERMTCTIQREVGQRLRAATGSSAYGLVSIITQTLADIDLIAIIPPKAFWPRPKVESVLLTIRPRPAEEVEVDDVPAFVQFVQHGFLHRRKMLKKAAESWSVPDTWAVFGRAGVSPDARPDAVSPTRWRALFHAVQSRSRR